MEDDKEPIQATLTKHDLTGKLPTMRSWFVSEIIDSSDIVLHGGSVKNQIFGEINYLTSNKKHWQNIQEISREDLFMIFDKNLSGHSSTVIQKNNRKIMIIFGGFDGLFYSNSIYLVYLGIKDFHSKLLFFTYR